MPGLANDAVWKQRLDEIDSRVRDIQLPELADRVDQDEEWCEVFLDDERRRFRCHDYADIFDIPGLYEELFYERLECCSPSYIVQLLRSVSQEYEACPGDFRVLDVGAGNGMVGDELRDLGVQSVFGIDIVPAAREATQRDRPEVYEDYRILDLTDVPEADEEALRRCEANCLTTVAALGFGDIPPLAFAKALDLIATPGWVAFTLKEDFLREQDTSGFSRLIRRLNRDGFIRTLCYRRYKHRISIDGKPLYYVAVVATKIKDLNSELLESLASPAM